MLFYKLHQSLVQLEMRKLLNDKETTFQKITLSTREFYNKQICNNEITINGKLYDIKSHKIVGDQVQLFIIYDSKEESILKEIKGFLTESNQTNKDLPNQLQKLLTLNYIFPNKIHINNNTVMVIDIFFHFNIEISNGYSIPLFPPPKFS